MIRTALAATALLAASPALAQSTTQDEIEARYDRALAAGYKALFLCSAISNAERNGAMRTPESVEAWELTGVQEPLDQIIPELEYSIVRVSGPVSHVSVEWADDAVPRLAVHQPGAGCSLQPIGAGLSMLPSGSGREAASIPDAVPFRDAPLAAAVNRAFQQEGPRTTAVVVLRDGEMLGERYVADFGPRVPQRTWSVAKSIAATLVGAAIEGGRTTTGRASGLGGSFADARSKITIDHLLRMASGRYSDTPGNRTNPLYYGGSSVEETALHWPLVHKPGEVFRYANNDTLVAIEAIKETFRDAPPAAFFEKVGMHHTVAETDWKGNYILSSQVWSTARDLARIGNLYLNDGILPNGERILPTDWAEYVSTPSGPQPDGPFGYGAGFWLFNKSEGIPSGTFAAMGNRGQFIIIVPSLNVVIVRRGEDPAGSRFDIASFTRDVLESITE
ncbi:serine hydrolase domain-containing protein [Qipengyuania aquimaris]|uniref:Beta-lactamase family protein n=1 Tax=Qipengyuania aquimaris TaxID=255984 RepID=A0A9Q3S0S6_9SPHN|nr:serine hydrolase [Qipengyuania aquimaris]MBY6217966.1 beta-lactamase family protein [Qipengyuania aquimaris]